MTSLELEAAGERAVAVDESQPEADLRLLTLLQYADGLFPAGGYAHSFGLETYVVAARVRDPSDLEAFCRIYLAGTAGPCDAAALVLARRHGRKRRWAALADLDRVLEAMKPIAEGRQASRQMGRQTLRIAAGTSDHRLLRAAWERVESGRLLGHHPLILGLAAVAFGWGALEAAAAYLYSTAALLVNAAVRLLPLGQLAGQRALLSLQPLIGELAAAAASCRGADDLWSFCPGIDIAGMRHATLAARLFRS